MVGNGQKCEIEDVGELDQQTVATSNLFKAR